MPHAVFVSYSQPDRACAFDLVSHIEAEGVSVWVAPRDISPSADWAAEIIDGISAARLMVMVFSSHSNSSPQVHREVERAVHKRIPILTFRIEDVAPDKSLEYFLSSQHWMDAFPPPLEPHYARLRSHLSPLLKRSEGAQRTALGPATAATPTDAAQPVERAGAVHAVSISASDVQRLERQLARHVGPVAKILIKRAMARSQDWDELTQRLAAEIEPDAARREFIQSIRP